ncbi:signal peptidase I [Paenibacillus sp. MMO-58]|uniref:signal peptidase I n=1 Tax=Paenibacillus sp. MMO-58 TaxID=3081290 RepID=UPI003017BAA7
MKFKLVILVFFVLVISGCQEQNITNDASQETPTIVAKENDSILVDNNNDGMSRRQGEYDSQVHGKLVVNPNYYIENKIQRGDVIYYKLPKVYKIKFPRVNAPEFGISRVIALPGELVQIKKGQIYINEKRLNTFYGKMSSWGENEKEFFSTINEPGTAICDEVCQKNMKDFFNMNVGKFEVPVNQLYVLGDTGWRSIDSNIHGPVPITNIIGKVIGYAEK